MMPLHERIRSQLEARILSGKLQPGDRLPVEHDLMRHYACSRMTVNKAISRLAQAGLVQRRRKAGTFVAAPRAHSMVLAIPDLASEVAGRGQEYRFRVINRRTRESARGDAFLKIGGPVLEIEGLHLADGKPLAHERRTINLKAVPDIREAEFDPLSPGTWLLRHIPWTEADTRISASGADATEAALLEVAVGSACLVVDRRTWRAEEPITAVRQSFTGHSYALTARFGPSETGAAELC